MNIYACPTCHRRVVGRSGEKPCAWCREPLKLLGVWEPPEMFDPAAYAREVKAHPENFFQLSDLVAEYTAVRGIMAAKTMDELKSVYTASVKARKDPSSKKLFAEAKDRRKEILIKGYGGSQ